MENRFTICVGALVVFWNLGFAPVAFSQVPGSMDFAFGMVAPLQVQEVTSLVGDKDDSILTLGAGPLSQADQSSVVFLTRYKAQGGLDPGFGTGGMIRIEASGARVWPEILKLQSDGKILVLAKYPDREIVWKKSSQFSLLRFLPDGKPDTGFGHAGILMTNLRSSHDNVALVVQADGKILLAGEFGVGSNLNAVINGIERFKENGEIDGSFGASGIAKLPYYPNSHNSLALIEGVGSPPGILVAGALRDRSAVLKLGPSGRPEASFGKSGLLTMNIPHRPYGVSQTQQWADGLLPLDQGRVLVSGFVWEAPFLLILDPTGKLVQKEGIGPQGIGVYPSLGGIGGFNNFSVTRLKDGSFLGSQLQSATRELQASTLYHFSATGELDQDFTHANSQSEWWQDKTVNQPAVQSNGRIVTAAGGKLLRFIGI